MMDMALKILLPYACFMAAGYSACAAEFALRSEEHISNAGAWYLGAAACMALGFAAMVLL